MLMCCAKFKDCIFQDEGSVLRKIQGMCCRHPARDKQSTFPAFLDFARHNEWNVLQAF